MQTEIERIGDINVTVASRVSSTRNRFGEVYSVPIVPTTKQCYLSLLLGVFSLSLSSFPITEFLPELIILVMRSVRNSATACIKGTELSKVLLDCIKENCAAAGSERACLLRREPLCALIRTIVLDIL